MSDLKLQQDELELLASYEAEEWKSVKKLKEQKEQNRAYARATFRKDKRVNIRISEKDLLDLQKRAIRQGIPYQTLLYSVLHIIRKRRADGEIKKHTFTTCTNPLYSSFDLSMPVMNIGHVIVLMLLGGQSRLSPRLQNSITARLWTRACFAD